MSIPSVHLSSLALQRPRRSDRITRRSSVYGLLLHTTGGGIPAKAVKTGRAAAEVALAWYRESQGHDGQQGANGYPWGGPGYVIAHDGTVYQIADDDILTNHAGGPHRDLYLSGAWVAKVSQPTVEHWRDRWTGVKSPAHLFPSRSPNADYVGCEMVPCGAGLGTPMRAGLRFTQAQHDAAIALGRDLVARHGWPADWARGPRLVGHEDVQPIERHDAGGGWDPGWLRAAPYFDFEYVRQALAR
jgi:hypothetical protein